MKRRIVSVLMALVMALSLLPVQALAEDAAVGESVTEIEQAEQTGEGEEPGDPEEEQEPGEPEEPVREFVQGEAQLTVSTAAMAAGTAAETTVPEDIYAALVAGGSLKLLNDVDYGGSMSVGVNLTIDLNGYVLKMTGIKVENGGSLTIIDSRPDAEHKFTPNTDGLWVLDEQNGTKTVRGGVIYGGTGSIGTSVYGGGVYVEGGGTFTVNGGNIVGCTASATFQARGGGVFVAEKGTFTMSGGSIAGCTTVGGYSYGGGIYNEGTVNLSGTAEIRDCHAKDSDGDAAYGGGISDNGEAFQISGNVRITGCTASGGGTDAVSMDTGSVISGGTFDGSVQNTGTISGGTFNGRVVNSNMITDGIFNGEVVNDYGTITGGTFNGVVTNYSTITEGAISGITVTYQVNGAHYATQIVPSGSTAIKPVDPINSAGAEFLGWDKDDGTKWDFNMAVTENTTLMGWVYVPVISENALLNALSGSAEVIRLTGDIDISSSLTVNRTVTLDLNNHVLTITGENSFITVSGQNTTLTLTDSAETKTERKFRINQDGTWVPDENGDKTVSGGVITGGITGVDLYGTPTVGGGVLIENRGTLTVTDGTVNAPIGNRKGTIAGSGTFNGTVINEDKLTGGTFNGPVANYKGSNKADATISGGIFYGTVANGYNYYVSGQGEMTLDGRNGGLIADGTFYGKVTNAFYSTISGGSFYGEVDNRDRSDFHPAYLGILAGGTFYAGNPGTVAGGCCTVTYEDGSGEYAKQIVQTGEKAIEPDVPSRQGYQFTDWYLDDTKYDFNADVTGNMTLTAKWTVCDHSGHTGAKPTCTTSVICTVCKGTIAALGHDWSPWTSNSDNTHTHSCLRVGCGYTETLSCADGDANHICDDCGKIISNHVDGDNDHVCDICGKTISNHVDGDANHICDDCGKIISNHEDGDNDHVCDICRKTISNHVDADNNHICDICGKTISNHVDTDKNHICDDCGKVISNHVDVDNNHICDDCRKVISDHKDTDRNHICDICGKTISNHADGNHDHICDICSKAISNHTGGTATCTEKAKCSVCGAEYGDLNPAHHANLVNVPAKAATTSAAGNIEYWHCGGCGKYYKDAAAQDEITQEDTVIAKRRVYYAPSLYPVRNGTNPPSGTEYSGGVYGLIFRAAVSGITGVQVDGRTVGRGSYTVEGSYPVELYLKASYLNRLAKGGHTLTVLTDSGSLTAAFTIGSGKSSPTTFDAGIAVYTAAAVTSLTGLELLRRRRKEEE